MPRAFPIVCAALTLIAYLVAYTSLSSRAPPPQAVVDVARPSGLRQVKVDNSQSVPQSSLAASEHTAGTGRQEIERQPQAKDEGAASSEQVQAAPARASEVPLARPALVLDGSLDAALRYAVPAGKPKFIMLTFGNLGVKDQLLNFVAHVKRIGAAHVIGGVDVGAFDLMVALGSPAYKTPLASEAYHMDGSNQHSSGSWKRFAGMRTGEVAKMILLGYTVMHTDCDVRASSALGWCHARRARRAAELTPATPRAACLCRSCGCATRRRTSCAAAGAPIRWARAILASLCSRPTWRSRPTTCRLTATPRATRRMRRAAPSTRGCS